MLISLLALAIIGIPLLFHKFGSPLPPSVLGGFAIAAILVWAGGMVLKTTTGGRNLDHLTVPDKALGYMMAKQMLDDGVPIGVVNVNQVRANNDTWKKRNKARLAGIEEALKNTSFTIDTSGSAAQISMEMAEQGGGIETASGGVATISFNGPPRKFGKVRHPYYVFVNNDHSPNLWYAGLKSKQIAGVVRDKPASKRSKPVRETPEAVFDSRFEMITSSNLPAKQTLFPTLQSMSN